MDGNTKTKVWKDINGYEGLYCISEFGDVYSLRSKRNLKGKITKGYKTVNLYKDNGSKNFSFHRLVATHFVANPENKVEVNHIDEDKLNNKAENLMWVTPKENSNWGSRNERLSIANKLRFARPLSLSQVRNIKVKRQPKPRSKPVSSKRVAVLHKDTGEVLRVFESVTSAARSLGLRQGNVSYVCHGKANTSGGYKFKFIS